MVLKYRIIIVPYSQFSCSVDFKHIVSACVVDVVKQACKKHSSESSLRKVFTEVGYLKHVIRCAHNRNPVLEVMERILVLAVLLIHLRYEFAEGVGINHVGIYNFRVGEHSPDVLILHSGVSN